MKNKSVKPQILSHAQGDQVLLRFVHNFPTNKEHPGHCLTWGESPKKDEVCVYFATILFVSTLWRRRKFESN